MTHIKKLLNLPLTFEEEEDEIFLDAIEKILNEKIVTEPHIKRLLNLPLDFSEFMEERESSKTLKELLNVKASPTEVCLQVMNNDKSLPIGLLKDALHSKRR